MEWKQASNSYVASNEMSIDDDPARSRLGCN